MDHLQAVRQPKEIVVEETGKEADWSVFREKLINAKSADGKKGARYAVYDVGYEAEGGAGSRNKITFIAWSPDDAGIKVRTICNISITCADFNRPRWCTLRPRMR